MKKLLCIPVGCLSSCFALGPLRPGKTGPWDSRLSLCTFFGCEYIVPRIFVKSTVSQRYFSILKRFCSFAISLENPPEIVTPAPSGL